MSCFDDGNCGAVQIEYDGNGTLTQYTFPFPYEDELEVHVEKWDPVNYRYNRIDRDQWSFDNLTTIKFATAPDYTFRIMRETDLEEMEVTFYPGSSIRAQDLNANFEQLQHAIQEGWCRVSDEFYCYLDEFIFDKRDAWTKEEQQTNKVVPEGNKIFLDDAITARTDTYLQDTKPTQPPYEQGGKRWYDTDKVLNYIWDDTNECWVDYNLAGPQGPAGNDGDHTILISLSPPTVRTNGLPVREGDLWFNNCTGETWILYDGSWMTLVGGVGERGPQGEPGQDSTVEGPEGPEGPAGTFQTIVSLRPPTQRPDETPLQDGDLWFNNCNGQLFIYYDELWLGISDATGPKGDTGEQGPQGNTGPKGDPPGLQDPAATATGLNAGVNPTADVTQDEAGDLQFSFGIPKGDQGERGEPGNQGQISDNPPTNPDVGDLWFDTSCPTGLYIWDGNQWVGASIPGPAGPKGDPGTYTFNAPLQEIGGTVTFDWSSINEIPNP